MILCSVLGSDVGRIWLNWVRFCEVPFLLNFGVQNSFKYGWFCVPRRVIFDVFLLRGPSRSERGDVQ